MSPQITNHPNRGWRRRWTVHLDSLVAVHETGVTVRVLDDGREEGRMENNKD